MDLLKIMLATCFVQTNAGSTNTLMSYYYHLNITITITILLELYIYSKVDHSDFYLDRELNTGVSRHDIKPDIYIFMHVVIQIFHQDSLEILKRSLQNSWRILMKYLLDYING